MTRSMSFGVAVAFGTGALWILAHLYVIGSSMVAP